MGNRERQYDHGAVSPNRIARGSTSFHRFGRPARELSQRSGRLSFVTAAPVRRAVDPLRHSVPSSGDRPRVPTVQQPYFIDLMTFRAVVEATTRTRFAANVLLGFADRLDGT